MKEEVADVAVAVGGGAGFAAAGAGVSAAGLGAAVDGGAELPEGAWVVQAGSAAARATQRAVRFMEWRQDELALPSLQVRTLASRARLPGAALRSRRIPTRICRILPGAGDGRARIATGGPG